MKLFHRIAALALSIFMLAAPLDAGFAEAIAYADPVKITAEAATDAPAEAPAPTPAPEAIPQESAAPAEASTESPAPTAEPSSQPTDELISAPDSAPPTAEATAEPESEVSDDISSDHSVPPELSPEPSMEPSTEPSAEPSMDASADPSVEPSIEPSIEPSVEPSETPEAESLLSAAELPEFTCGYVRLLYESVAYDGASLSAQALCYLESGVLYAANRRTGSDCDRLEVHFDDGNGEIVAWVDAQNLRPLSEAESAEFIQARSSAADARSCCLDSALPLGLASAHSVLTVSLSNESTDEPVVPAMLVAQTEMRIGLKEKRAISVSFSDGGSYALTYTSANSKIAQVNADGVITGKTRGKTTIYVRSELGNEISIKVQVLKAPKSIKLTAARNRLGVGESLPLTVKMDSAYASAFTYSSSQPGVAQVDENGVVYALSAGTATISAKTYNGKSARFTFTVLPAPESVSFAAAEVTLGVGESSVLSAAPNAGSMSALSYTSDNEDVLRIDPATGSATALAIGEACITATSHNGKSATQKIIVKAAPSCIRIAKTSVSIGVGESLLLPEVTLGAEGEDCAGSYTLKSSNKKYVSVSGNTIRGLRRGSATITITSYNGHRAKLTVKVLKAPSKVSLSASSLTLGAGECIQLKAKLPSKTAGSVYFSSSDDAIASVGSDGVICAVAPGTATIYARSYNGKTAKCTVTVKAAPESVAFEQSSGTLGVKETLKLAVHLSENSAGSYSFRSLNPEILSVDQNGKVTALAVGSGEVEVSTYNSKTARCAICVKAAPEGVRLQESSLTLSVGDSYQLAAPVLTGADPACSSFTYKSSGTKYVTVNSSGKITARRTGTKKITVSTYNGKTASLNVTVKAAPKSIAFAEKSATLYIGLSLTPGVTFSNGASGNYRLSSSNEAVASISADGHSLTALSAGSAVITATSFNGKTASMQLSVPALPDEVTLSPGALTLGAGDTGTLTATLLPAGSGCNLQYESSDPAVASVSENGKVTAVAAGSAEITVFTANGHTATSRITVLEAPTGLQLSPRSAVRCLDEECLQLTPIFATDAQGGRISYTSSDSGIASVSASGCVSFHAAGKVRITAQTYNGCRAVCDLTIGVRPGEMSFPSQSIRIAVGDTLTIAPSFDEGCESYTCAVSDSAIAAASGNQVSALQIGSTTLTATSRSGLTASCTLNVVAAPTGIALDCESIEMILGVSDTLQLNAQTLPDGVGSVYYLSSDPSIASVDYTSGEIEALSAGECTITACTYDGRHSAQCSVTVRNLLHGVKIGIDPGHQAKADTSKESSAPSGGRLKAKVSSGTRGRYTGVAEYVVNLQIGLKLRDALESFGAEVYMTRETNNVNISNQQRAKMMNELGVDMVLRIHLNGSSSSSSKNGMSSYVRKSGAYKAESAAISKLLLKYMAAETGAKNLGVKYSSDYTGLNWSTVPSMLLELGYMTNPKEDRLLVTSEYQDKLVRGMVNGICEYMGREIPY